MKLIRSLLVGLLCLLPLPAMAAGTIFGLPLSQQLDENGDPMSGGKLYLYEAGTSTPATAYGDFGLTTGNELSHPITLDSSGRIPEFWLDDGSYRVRLTDADGNEIFDISSTTALGASSGGGGGGGSAVSASAIFDTGDLMWQPVNAARSGWVRANGRTVGSSASGATERANADTEELFTFLWTNFDDTLCPVSGGRGASAAADWAANKAIGTLDMRGRLAYGLDTMGTTAASVVVAATTAGGAFGQEEKVITQANFPNTNLSHSLTAATHNHSGPSHTHTGPSHAHSFSATTSSDGSHTHTEEGTSNNQVSAGSGENAAQEAGNTTSSNGAHTHTISGTSGAEGTGATGASGTGNTGNSGSLTVSGTVSTGGSGTAFDTLPPGRAGSWYFKL